MKKIILAVLFLIPFTVKGYELLPNFQKTAFETKTYEKTILIDTNQVLSNYRIANKHMVDAKINGNNLEIEALEMSGNGLVVLINNIDNKTRVNLEFRILGGNIKIRLSNKEKLTGTTFGVYKNDLLLDTITIGEDNIGYSNNFISGEYIVKQLTNVSGFQKVENQKALVPHTDTTILTLYNSKIVKTLKIIKSYHNELEPEINFDIYDFNNNFIISCKTNSVGECSVSLAYGEYLVKQTNTLKEESLYNSMVNINEETSEIYELLINNSAPIESSLEETKSNPEIITKTPILEQINNEEKNSTKEEIIEESNKELTNPHTKDSVLNIAFLGSISIILFLIIKKVKA